MATARFLHAADLHLGSPLKSIGDTDVLTDQAVERIKKLVNQAFDRLIAVAIQERVDFVVLSGDIYDTADRDPGAQRRFLLGLRQLVENNIKVFMVHGNHDPFTHEIKNVLLPDGVTVFPAGELGTEIVTMSNGVEVLVAGISYSSKEQPDNLVPKFADLRHPTIVGLLHTNVGGVSQHGNYAPCTAADLDESPVNYWALGHIHQRSVNETRNGWWAYPGNLQGRSVKEAECGPKGVLIVDVDENGAIHEPRFVQCCALQFRRVQVSVDDLEEIAGLNDIINDELQTVVTAARSTPVLVRLEIVGRTDIEEILEGAWDQSQMLEESGDILGDGLVVKVRSSCMPRINLEDERQRQTLLGIVLNDLDQRDLSDEVRADVTQLLVNELSAQR